MLLLDEATSALDPGTERAVLENIRQKAAGRTCILTTHRMSVLSVCDRAYRVSDGRIAPLDRHEPAGMRDQL